MSAPAASAWRAWSSRWTCQSVVTPAALHLATKVVASPKAKIMAFGLRSRQSSSSSGRFASDQVMNPAPTG